MFYNVLLQKKEIKEEDYVLKKGDLLLCNDGVTEVEIVGFDDDSIIVAYNGELHKRPRSHIGKNLHYQNHCWQCGSRVTSLDCDRCNYCGWYICSVCGSCHKGECVYSAYGFDENGIHRNGTRFSYTGYDVNGYDRDGYNNLGYNRDGYNREGYDKKGYDCDGYNREGYDNRGYNREGYDNRGYNREGFNRDGLHFNGTRFSDLGYDCEGYDHRGYDKKGYSREGFNYRGFNCEGIHLNGTRYCPDGYDVRGYDKEGYNPDGYDEYGFDRNGYNRAGYNREGYNLDGYNKKGYDRHGYNREGFNKAGINRDGYDKYGLDARWRALIGRKVEYVITSSDGITEKKRGIIKHCYFKDKIHYVDIKFKNGEIYKSIEFSRMRKKGVLFLLKKITPPLGEAANPKKTSRTTISQKTESDDVKEIFTEMQDDYNHSGEHHTGFGGCYGEDDRESEYYNPMHPDDE